MLGDLRRELYPFALQLLDSRFEPHLRPKGYDRTASGLRSLGLPAVEPYVEPFGVDLGSRAVPFDHRELQGVLVEVEGPFDVLHRYPDVGHTLEPIPYSFAGAHTIDSRIWNEDRSYSKRTNTKPQTLYSTSRVPGAWSTRLDPSRSLSRTGWAVTRSTATSRRQTASRT